MEPGWSPHDCDDEELEDLLFQAARLYDHLIAGRALQPLTGIAVLLGADEAAYAVESMQCARYYAIDSELPMPYPSSAELIDAAINNRASRHLDGAQWRDAYTTRLVLTDRRLMISLAGRWASYPHGAIVEFLPVPEAFCLVLTYQDTAPLRLRGPTVPSLSVALAGLLYAPEHLTQIPGFTRFDAAASG